MLCLLAAKLLEAHDDIVGCKFDSIRARAGFRESASSQGAGCVQARSHLPIEISCPRDGHAMPAPYMCALGSTRSQLRSGLLMGIVPDCQRLPADMP